MTDLLIAFFSKALELLWAQGPLGMLGVAALLGWGVAGYVWLTAKKKGRKSEPTTTDYVDYIKKMHEKHLTSVTHLNDRHHTTVSDLNEKRLADIKELASAYSELAQNTLTTLDKLILKLNGSNELNPAGDESIDDTK